MDQEILSSLTAERLDELAKNCDNVYCDDQQITQETWVKVGLDRANPRVDIHIWDGSV